MWVLAACVAALGLYVSFCLGYLRSEQCKAIERVGDMELFVGKHYHLLLDRVEAMEMLMDKPEELEAALRHIRIDKGKENLM